MKHRVEWLAARAAVGMARLMPSRLLLAAGSVVGSLFYIVDAHHRRVAAENVAAALPQRSAAEQRAIVRGAFRHFGQLLFELLKWSTLTPDQMLARVEFDGEERVKAAAAQGRGIIFVTGHFGFWELQNMVHALRLPPMAVMARAIDNPAVNEMLERMRTRTGAAVIYRQGGIRKVLRRLQSGGAIGVLIDQHVLGRDAVCVKFFDRPEATTSAVAALALRTGALVIPLFALPLGGGRYRMVYEPPVPPPAADVADPIHDFTQRCTDVLEMYVRRRPDLWLWMHRRWRVEGADVSSTEY